LGSCEFAIVLRKKRTFFAGRSRIRPYRRSPKEKRLKA
jgi:hypothetical protein